jgi:ElaB/YqjD/DUF883 family membrane-anchored ribosome-binding protein
MKPIQSTEAIMETIVSKIQKLLALGERGGTEAEAEAAMRKVHELLARHNLSLDDVKGEAEKDEDYVKETEEGTNKQPWQRIVWAAVAELYFCSYFSQRNRGTGDLHHVVIGKPSNIAVVKYMAAYLIRTGQQVAKEAAKDSVSKASFINSFKKGYSHRIHFRVKEEIAKAKAGKVTDSSTGTALILHPLYDQTKRDLDQFFREHGINVTSRSTSSRPSNHVGYMAGKAAADSVSLANNGVGHNKAARQIGVA